MPIIIALVIPFLINIGAKSILQAMLVDKQNKMKETLRLMSLSNTSYGLSFLFFQSAFALMSAILTGVFLINNENVFP